MEPTTTENMIVLVPAEWVKNLERTIGRPLGQREWGGLWEMAKERQSENKLQEKEKQNERLN